MSLTAAVDWLRLSASFLQAHPVVLKWSHCCGVPNGMHRFWCSDPYVEITLSLYGCLSSCNSLSRLGDRLDVRLLLLRQNIWSDDGNVASSINGDSASVLVPHFQQRTNYRIHVAHQFKILSFKNCQYGKGVPPHFQQQANSWIHVAHQF